MKNLGLLSLLLIFVFSACRKDVNEVTVDPNTPDPTIENYEPQVENITAGLTLFVVDENETPVIDAKVSLNGQSYTTDDFGHLIINDETLNSLGSLVKVDKAGYFKGSRRFFPVAGKNSRVKIQLLPKNFNRSFTAADGGEIGIDNVAKVVFPPNSIQTADGEIYEGTVMVASQWINPSKLSCLDQMPGNLQGVNSELEDVALATYGMIAVELEDELGQPLNIAEGYTAEISMPLTANLINGAPAQIPLWSYNETYGLWVEEGVANLEGNKYVGEVSHFSFWNCDIPYDNVNLEMTLVDEQAVPLANTLVTLTTSGSTNTPIISGSGATDQDGLVAGFVPANEILSMEVFDLCGVVIYTGNIGPFDVDTNLGDVTIPGTTTVNNTTITGDLLDCNDDPITNGMIIASFDGQTSYHYLTSSNFSITFSTCNITSEVEIVAYNLDNLKKSDPAIIPSGTSTDLGIVKACDNQVLNQITVIFDGQTVVFEDTSIDPFATGTNVYGLTTNGDVIRFRFEGLTTGTYDDTECFFEALIVSSLGWSFSPNSVRIDNLVVTEYDTRLVGSFDATAFTATGSFPMNCAFDFEL